MARTFFRILFRSAEDTLVTHDGVEHAGYLSFLGLLSLFPFLVFLVAMAGFLGEGEVGLRFIALLRNNLPGDVVEALLPRIDEILSGPSPGLITLSMLAALWTASSAVEGYRTVLNRAYRVGTPPAYVWRRLLSIVQLLLFMFLIIIGMSLLIFVPLVLEKLQPFTAFTPQMQAWWESQSWAGAWRYFSVLVVLFVICSMYFILPNIRQNLRAVVPGALVTITGWIASVEILRWYLSRFEQLNLIYGSLGGVIAALLFFYILNLVFIFGAELNYQMLTVYGRRIEERHATKEASAEA